MLERIKRRARAGGAHLHAYRVLDLRLMIERTEAPPRFPDFVGVGAQRAGTTWWFSLLSRHPDVRIPRSGRKELHFLDRYQSTQSIPANAARRYMRQFAYPTELCAGEWTPRYMHDDYSIPQLAALMPGVKVLVLLRDPMERAISGIRYTSSRHSASQSELVTDAVARSKYSDGLRRVYDHFPTSQVLVQQFEACVADPQPNLERVCDFLGLRRHEFDHGKVSNTNASNDEPIDVPRQQLEEIRSELLTDAQLVGRLVGDLDLSLWSNTFRPD